MEREENALKILRRILLSLSLFLYFFAYEGRGLKNKIQEKVWGEKEGGYVLVLRERGKFMTDDE